MRPGPLVSLRRVLSSCALAALVLGAAGCKEPESVPEYTPMPVPGRGTGGSSPDAGQTPDAGVPHVHSDSLLFKLLSPGSRYDAQTREPLAADFLGSGASGLGSGGYVPTAVAFGPNGYGLVGAKFANDGTLYDTQVRTANNVDADLGAAASELARNGYVITAIVPGSGTTTFIGVKEQGATDVYSSLLLHVTNGPGVGLAAGAVGNEGYAVTAVASLSSGGYLVVGVKHSSESPPYSVLLRSAAPSGLQLAASELASAGYAITSMWGDGTGFTLVGVKVEGEQRAFTASVKLTPPGALYSGALDLATRGFLVTAMAYDGTQYVLVGMH